MNHPAWPAKVPVVISAYGTGLVNLAEMMVLKDGNVFSVTCRDGSLPVDSPHPLGIYMDDCRFLSGHELTLAGERLRLLVTTGAGGGAVSHELTNPQLRLPDGRELPLQTVGVRLERRLDAGGAVHERVRVHSYARGRVEADLVLRLRADFAPMLAVRGIVAPSDASELTTEAVDGGLRMQARGRDGVVRATTVTAASPPAVVEGSDLRFALSLDPGGETAIDIQYALSEGDGSPSRPQSFPVRTRVQVDDALVQRVVERSVADLQALRSRLDGFHYFSAGIPWYATLFGRDSIITAMQCLAWSPQVPEETLRLLADLLGRREDPVHEEQPGKVLHELRVGEVAGADLTPLARYYGTVDATPLWLCLLCDHADWSGDLTLFRQLRPQVEAMLEWIDGPGDSDGDGLLDYAARGRSGLRNQGWKDSEEGICDEDGRWLEPPIALVEAQAYVVRAKDRVAGLYQLDGDAATAACLRAGSRRVVELLERFWLDDRGYYAMALDGSARPTRALASNQGHLLWARAVTPERARAIRDALMGERMFTGWGIRTLGSGQPAYNPVGYHLGTVWPHDTAIIAAGLREYRMDEDFARVFEGLLDAASHSDSYRLPELFAGFSRAEFAAPVPYPVACRPQAWAAGTIPYLTQAGLGLIPDGLHGRLSIRRPSLPRHVDRVDVRGLRIAGSSVDLQFERAAGGHVMLADAHVEGDVLVSLEIRA